MTRNLGLSILLVLLAPLCTGQNTPTLFISRRAGLPEGLDQFITLQLDDITSEKWRVAAFDPLTYTLGKRKAVILLSTVEAERFLDPCPPILLEARKCNKEHFTLLPYKDNHSTGQMVAADSGRMILAGAFYLLHQLRLEKAPLGSIRQIGKPWYPIRITNDTPLNAGLLGYNTIETLWDATRVALFEEVRPRFLQKGDPGYKQALEKRSHLKEYLSISDTMGLDTIAYGDEFQFPMELVLSKHYRPQITEKGFSIGELESEWGMGRIFCFAKPRLWELYRIKYRSFLRDFPSIDYYQLRLGENTTFGRKKGYAGSGVYSIGGAPYCPDCRHITYEERIARTIRETHRLVASEAGKRYIHRTWDTRYDAFNNNPEVFTDIVRRLDDTRGLYFSTKYTFGDFWEYFDYNPTLSAAPHVPRIVEFQCTREYEGKGAFPNFLGEEFAAVHTWLREKKIPVKGVSIWHHGGGTGGPYPELDLWNQANIYASARLAWEPGNPPEKIAHDFGALYFGEDASEPISHLLLLSDDAVRKWRYFRLYSKDHKNKAPAELWIRDDVIRGDRSLYKIFEYCYRSKGPEGIDILLEEKKEAISIINRMLSLLETAKKPILSRHSILLPWGDKRNIPGLSHLLTTGDKPGDPLFISGKALFEFTETSLLYEKALAGILYHYCGAYFLSQRYRRTLDPGDKRRALYHLQEWRTSWEHYQNEIPNLNFCPSLFKDDGMVPALERARYYLDHPDRLELAWRIIGPFSNLDKKGFDAVYPPESQIDFHKEYQGLGQKVSWQPLPEEHHIDDLVELTKVFAPDDWITIYAYTELTSSRDQEALLLVGSDDAVKVWLNGKQVHANNVYRAARPGQDQVKIRLQKGKNKILVKLMEGIFGCGFYLQFSAVEGGPVPGLKGIEIN